MADKDTIAPVDQNTQVQSDQNQAAQPVPAQSGPLAQEDLADLVPVEESEKPLAGAHSASATSDLVPVAGTEKKLSLPKPEQTIQASGVIGPTAMGAREHDFHNWLQDVQTDVKNGSASTWVGAMLKKMGAKGTDYGVSPEIGDFMAGPALGVPKALEGASEVAGELEAGVRESNLDYRKTVRGVNKMFGGTFQSLGPAGLVLAPGGEGLAVVGNAMLAQTVAQKAAEYMGADPDTVELVGNVAGLYAAGKIHQSLHPVVERFGVAVNNRTAAEQEYIMRSRELETARGQAAEMQQRAIAAAQKEGTGQGTSADTDAARSAASEAAKNVANAQKAHDQAAARRADATIQVEKLGRKITTSADKTTASEYEAKASEQKKASDFFRKAVPSKGANTYTPEDEDIARAHMEAAKGSGAKIVDLPSAYEAVEGGRQGVEDQLKPHLEKYDQEPLTDKPEDSPKMKVTAKLAEMAKVDGNFENAMDALSEFNITDPTVGEAQDMLTKLNNYNRAAMKGANNWDIYNMIETNPGFAARYFMADELRDGLYSKLESHGVEGAREARGETASLIRVRDAIGAQIRANRGGTTVRGSGTQNRLRLLTAKLTGKTIKGAGIAAGAEMGGPVGAVAGGAIGEMAAQPVEDFLAPRDMTRDQHIEKSMKYKGTNRKPVEIKGPGTPAIIPTEPTPPAPKDTGPIAVEFTPRENTELHAELAAHYGESNLEDSTYQELEQQLRDDVAAKNRNGVALDPAEKSLLTKVLKADSADRATREAANKPSAQIKIDPEEGAKIVKEADQRAAEGESTKLNPHLISLGRGDESALVSHSPAMKAHAPAMPIPGLPEGITSEDAHMHEWAHTAIGAVDGLEPVEIRSDTHPKSEKGAGATTVFNAGAIRDAIGNVDPEALGNQETQWLTHKMAGPASHEVFKGMPKEEVEASPATRSDFREARAIVREVHPDFTASQVQQVVDAAYDRARDFLTKPHIADRIRANAAVREEGLSPTLHASHGRVNQFTEDIRNAHNEYTGGESGPDGGGVGEGGEKAAQPATEGKKNAGAGEGGRGEGTPKSSSEAATARRVAESKVVAEPEVELRVPFKGGRTVPPERTTGEYDESIKKGGAIPGGIQKGDPEIGLSDYVLFHDPTTGSTLALPTDKITSENVKSQLQKSRAQYLAARPEESRIPTKGQPGYDEEIHKGIKPEESAVSKKDDPFEKAVKHYGTTEDIHKAGYIGPDGRMLDFSDGHASRILDHGNISEVHDAENPREQFSADTGAIRILHSPRQNYVGVHFDYEHPPTDAQLDRVLPLLKEGTKVEADVSSTDISKTGSVNLFVGGSGLAEATDMEGLRRAVNDARRDAAQSVAKRLGSEPNNWVEKAADTKGEGFSFHPSTGEAPKDGFMVETELNRGQSYDHPPTAEDIRAFTENNKDVLAENPDLYVGGYKNTLGLSKKFTDRAAAEKLGKKTNQISIYDVAGGKEIPTGGTGKLTPEQVAESNIGKVSPQEVRDSIENNNKKDAGTKRDVLNAIDPKLFESRDWSRQMIQPNDKRIDLEESPSVRSRVNDYKKQFKAGSEFPPVALDTRGSKLAVLDGVNRLQAAQELGVPIDAYVGKETKSPKGSSVPLMDNPLPVKGTMEGGEVGTLDLTKALNKFSREQLPALEPGSEPKEMVARAKTLAADEAKYQLAQSKTGTEWYTTEMKDHDKVLQDLRPELASGEKTDAVPDHPVNLTLFKAGEAILSSGQKPYANVKSALRAWDAYKETGEFPLTNPAPGKEGMSWGPRGVAAYANALNNLNRLIQEKGEKGAADWLLSEHPVSELKGYNEFVSGKKTDERPGATIIGEKRGPFMQNLHGIESKFTADMWVSRTWNRWMGTLDLDPRIEEKGKMTSESDTPRNNTERGLMRESFEKTAQKLNLSTSSLQAVLWYYEQALYRAHGLPVESWSFSDAAKRVAKEAKAVPEAEQTGFDFGENAKAEGGLAGLAGQQPKKPGRVTALDLINALKNRK